MSIKALVFDLDGTLANTIGQIGKAVNATLVSLKREPLTQQDIALYVGNGMNYLLARAISRNYNVDLDTFDKSLLNQSRAYFKEYYAKGLAYDFELYDDVASSLHYFKEQGLKLFVLSNKPHQFVIPLLEHMGLSQYIEEALGSEVLEYKKPDPRPLQYLLDKHHIKNTEAMMVGDSINDLQCAINAKVKSVIFTYGYHGQDDVRAFKADYIFDKFIQLKQLF